MSLLSGEAGSGQLGALGCRGRLALWMMNAGCTWSSGEAGSVDS